MKDAFLKGLAALLLIAGAQAQAASMLDAQKSMRNSVVYLSAKSYDERGVPIEAVATGMVISPYGHLLTVYHLFRDIQDKAAGPVNIKAMLSSKYSYPVDVRPIMIFDDYDLAILKFPDTGQTFAPVCINYDEISSGTEIGTSGFPSAADIDYIDDVGTVGTLNGPGARPDLWRVEEMPFNSGQSGSPVYLSDASVIGVAVGSVTNAEGLHYMQPLRRLKSQLNNYAECKSSSQNVEPPPRDSTEVVTCVENRFDALHKRPFVREGSVRCPGGGCLFQSSDCNHRSAELKFDASHDYRIDAYDFISTAANDAANGPVESDRDDWGITSVSILLKCAPSARPGAGGGWSNGQLKGVEKHIDFAKLRESLLNECRLSHGLIGE